MRYLKIFLFIYIFLLYHQICEGCTGIYAKKDSIIVFGNNEDHGDPNCYIWFERPWNNKFGLVFYGFEDLTPQGGMNEKGLSFDCFAHPPLEVTNSSHLPHVPSGSRNGEWLYQMLENYETVDEAISYLDQYNLYFFRTFQLFLTDRFGNAAVVEGDTIIHKNGDFQILTNFLHSDPDHGNYPCWRYSKAFEMLSTADHISTGFFKDILSETHTTNTCYSNIHDPENVTIYLYYMHQFENVVTIDLKEELKKGDRIIQMSSLFQNSDISPNHNVANKHHIILYPNYPNPFNEKTVVQFQLYKSIQLNVRIYDQLGRKVRSLSETRIWLKGNHRILWDGQDDFGNQVSAGIYILQLKGAEFNMPQKLLLIK